MQFRIFGAAIVFSSLTYANNLCLDLFNTKVYTPSRPERPLPVRETLEKPNLQTVKARMDVLSSLTLMIKKLYGPLQYKEALQIIKSIDHLEAEFKEKIKELNPLQDREFEALMVDFVSRLNDGHVSLKLNSNYSRELPFQMTYLNGKYYINWTSAEFLNLKVRKPEIMDEVIEIENVDVESFRKRYSVYMSEGNEHSSRSLFAMRIGSLSESSGLPLQDMNPNGLRLTLISRQTGEKYKITVPYKEKGTPFISRNMSLIPSKANQNEMSSQQKTSQIIEGQRPFRDAKIANQEVLGEGRRLGLGGESEFTLPADAVEIKFPTNETIEAYEARAREMSNKKDPLNRNFLRAHVYNAEINGETKRIGFLRIPSYMPANMNTVVYRLRHIIAVMNRHTDVLIVDQMNNPGGYVDMSDAVIRSLTPYVDPAKEMNFLFRPTRQWVQNFHETIERFKKSDEVKILLGEEKYKELLSVLNQNNQRILEAYHAHADFSLSEPVNLSTLNKVNQILNDITMIGNDNLLYSALMSTGVGDVLLTNQSYSVDKPIYFLINEKDFSGGDATPAGLQDQGRAKIIGIGATQTGGAGGTVESFEIAGLGQLSLTTSLMERPERARQGDGVRRFVENVGVKADTVIPLTLEDYMNGLKDTLATLHQLIGEDFKNKASQSQEKNNLSPVIKKSWARWF